MFLPKFEVYALVTLSPFKPLWAATVYATTGMQCPWAHAERRAVLAGLSRVGPEGDLGCGGGRRLEGPATRERRKVPRHARARTAFATDAALRLRRARVGTRLSGVERATRGTAQHQ